MLDRLLAFLVTACSWFKMPRQLTFGNLALRQQLAMLRQSVKQPRVSWFDYLFWVIFSQTVNGWRTRLHALHPNTVIRSHDRRSDRPSIHPVSAFASEIGMALGQVKTNEKSNEITATPELLRSMELKGCTVTIDAMGCQTAIAQQIVDQGGGYLLALRGNQSKLYEDVQRVFSEADFADFPMDSCETSDKRYGRTEVRQHWTLASVGLLIEEEYLMKILLSV